MTLGNGSGGALVDLSARAGLAWLPWIGMSCVALISAVSFALLQRDARFQSRLLIASGARGRRTQPTTA
jgi:hypothetical protein